MSEENSKFDRGMALRHEMFGAAGAEEAFANASDFSRPLQEATTWFCFGEIWQRPGLDHKTRSMLTIAMLIASGRFMQLSVHMRGAVANGVSETEIRELILHALLYCGIPSAVEATAIYESTLKKS